MPGGNVGFPGPQIILGINILHPARPGSLIQLGTGEAPVQFCSAASCSPAKLFLPSPPLIHPGQAAEQGQQLTEKLQADLLAKWTFNNRKCSGNKGGGKVAAASVHPLSIRVGFGAALPALVGPRASVYAIALFRAGRAEVLITVSQEEKNSAQINFPCPAHSSLNLANLCAKHHSLLDITNTSFVK